MSLRLMEELEEAIDTLDASFDLDTARKKEAKRPKMPKAAVLLGRTQEFESVTDSVIEGMDLIDSTEEADREEEWTDRTALEEDEREPDPRVQIVDRTAFYELTEEETAPERGRKKRCRPKWKLPNRKAKRRQNPERTPKRSRRRQNRPKPGNSQRNAVPSKSFWACEKRRNAARIRSRTERSR